MNFAHDYSKEGHELIPEDAKLAAKMRLRMAEFDSKYFMPIIKAFLGRWEDPQLNQELKDCLPAMEEYIKANLPEGSTGKDWLMGTKTATMLDCHV